MLRTLLVVLALTARASEPVDNLDSAFEKVPFEQWLVSPDQSGFRWSVHASRPELTYHQRLLTRVELQLDGADLAERRKNGELVFFIQLTDQAGRRYQNHGSIDLAKLEEGVRSQYLNYSHLAFVLPGDYRVSVAIFETATSQHSVRQLSLHVAPLKNDPLPEAWRGLPPVEFLRYVDPPDSWYQPGSTAKLYLPVTARHSIRPEILVNLTPSERALGRRPVPHRDLNALMPSLDVISQLDDAAAPMPVALLDLSRRKVVLSQRDVHRLDWAEIKNALGETNPGTIDVKSLEDRHQNARFFINEVRRRLDAPLPSGADGALRVLIVLSGVVEFESGEDLQPIQVEQPRDCRVYYFRFHTPPVARTPPPSLPMPGRRQHGRGMLDLPIQPSDQLAATLKPLAPRVFDIDTPDQFLKALAHMLEEIAGL